MCWATAWRRRWWRAGKASRCARTRAARWPGSAPLPLARRRQAAALGTSVGPRRPRARGEPGKGGVEALGNQCAQQRGEAGMVAHGADALHRQAKFAAAGGGFDVEVVDHFHMIGEKAEGGEHNSRGALGVELAEHRVE